MVTELYCGKCNAKIATDTNDVSKCPKCGADLKRWFPHYKVGNEFTISGGQIER
jgi:Zn finger protein HypA/HybF involved in hydrogenase expression